MAKRPWLETEHLRSVPRTPWKTQPGGEADGDLAPELRPHPTPHPGPGGHPRNHTFF